MEIIRIFDFCLKKFEKISKIILCVYFHVALVFIFVIAGICCFGSMLFPDYDTAYYWLTEILKSAVSVTGAMVIPVFLFEIMNIYLGLKTKNEQ